MVSVALLHRPPDQRSDRVIVEELEGRTNLANWVQRAHLA